MVGAAAIGVTASNVGNAVADFQPLSSAQPLRGLARLSPGTLDPGSVFATTLSLSAAAVVGVDAAGDGSVQNSTRTTPTSRLSSHPTRLSGQSARSVLENNMEQTYCLDVRSITQKYPRSPLLLCPIFMSKVSFLLQQNCLVQDILLNDS